MPTITDYIGIIKVGEQEYLTGSTLFGTCSSAANDVVKVVAVEGFTNFTPQHGLTIHVLFTNSNTISNPKLKIGTNSTTSLPIRQTHDEPVGTNISQSWRAGAIVPLTYIDGIKEGGDASDSYWILNSSIDSGASGLAVTWDNVSGAPDLSAIESLTGTSGYLKKTGNELWTLQTSQDATSAVAGITKVGASGGAATYEHIHGNIQNDGTLANASYAVITDENKKITAVSLQVNDNTSAVNTTATTFVSAVTQNSQGKISVTKANLPEASLSKKGIIQIGTGAAQALAGNSTITIAGNTINLNGGELTAATLRDSLKLSQALKFVGSTSTTMSDGYTGTPAGISIYTGTGAVTPSVGDLVIDSSSHFEYVCIDVTGTTYTWEKLGGDSSYALDSQVIYNTGTNGDLLYWSGTDTTTHLAANASTTKKFLSMTSSTPSWTTLSSSDVGLNNVTNDAQIPKSIGTTAGDIIYWSGANTPVRLGVGSANQVLTINSSTLLPTWTNAQISDDKVAQSPLTYNGTNANKEYSVLFKNTHSDYNSETAGVKFSSSSGYRITINPSTGTLTAKNLVGALRASDVKTALSCATSQELSFLHQSGSWKILSIDNSSKATAITAASLSGGTAGTATTASVSGGVLTITVGTDTVFQTLNTTNTTQFLTAATLSAS